MQRIKPFKEQKRLNEEPLDSLTALDGDNLWEAMAARVGKVRLHVVWYDGETWASKETQNARKQWSVCNTVLGTQQILS
ncbi:hypothetical protein NDU88_006173 [Pleurodeles waltl]|uniref:Uncharacterized protein n=1 Tax=Pleurodeles waltl TaxID=8319 RepID=A0AAV7MYF3_PLEWA|nr:hypothetical protein NDU88_006173 [Pleurodeles waltl]